jgi:hypothetical protein
MKTALVIIVISILIVYFIFPSFLMTPVLLMYKDDEMPKWLEVTYNIAFYPIKFLCASSIVYNSWVMWQLKFILL